MNLKKDIQNFSFVLIGKDYDESYTQQLLLLIESLGIKDTVHLIGTISTNPLSFYYKNACALMLVSLYEGFGIPIIEAMRLGVPVVTSNIFSMPEAGGDAALYVDPLDISAIAEHMYVLATNDKMRTLCIEKGYIQAKNFSWGISAQKVLRFFDTYAKTHK